MKGMERQRKGEDKMLTRGAESESMTEVSSYMLLVFIFDWKAMGVSCYDFGKENGRHFFKEIRDRRIERKGTQRRKD